MKRYYLHALAVAATLASALPFLMGCRNACPHGGKSTQQQAAKPQETKSVLHTDTAESDTTDYEPSAASQDTTDEKIAHTVEPAKLTKNLTYYKNLQKRLRQCEWHDDGYGVKIPSFFKTHHSEMIEDAPGWVDTWEYGDIKLCTWYGLGFWASAEGGYPVGEYHEVYLSNTQVSATVTYQSKEENHYFPDGFPAYSYQVFSGYTHDGMVYYLKRHCYTWNRDFGPHANVVVLIYPKELQSQVKPLIEMVKTWKYPLKRNGKV